MQNNPLIELQESGQSIWLDFLSRDILANGQLAQLINEDGLSGVTSNPAIFNEAISNSQRYEGQIRDLVKAGKNVDEIYQTITVDDIQQAADLLRPTYDETGGQHGFVSLEVSPHLAYDTSGTVKEARRLWRAVARPNVFIKVPGTQAGLPAITQLIREGINVNVTLLFGLPRYKKVAQAYLDGINQRLKAGKPVEHVMSVASFFLSRIDVLVDPKLEQLAKGEGKKAELAQSLRGQTAIASAKMAYQIYQDIFYTEEFRTDFEARGANRQRVLWASTSTKNPEYSDVKYVEALIGPETINTMPLKTIDAFRDHGQAEARLEKGLKEAYHVLSSLAEVGISIDDVTQQLEEEGVQKFIEPYDALLETLAKKFERYRVTEKVGTPG